MGVEEGGCRARAKKGVEGRCERKGRPGKRGSGRLKGRSDLRAKKGKRTNNLSNEHSGRGREIGAACTRKRDREREQMWGVSERHACPLRGRWDATRRRRLGERMDGTQRETILPARPTTSFSCPLFRSVDRVCVSMHPKDAARGPSSSDKLLAGKSKSPTLFSCIE